MQRLAVAGRRSVERNAGSARRDNAASPTRSRRHFRSTTENRRRAIDWTNPAATLERCIRGFQPWPNAYTHHNSHRLIIWRAGAAETAPPGALPGEIVIAHGDDLVVKCGDEPALRVIEVQPEARRRMSVRDFLNGAHLKIGDRFGEV